jgi:hypothetical protein
MSWELVGRELTGDEKMKKKNRREYEKKFQKKIEKHLNS